MKLDVRLIRQRTVNFRMAFKDLILCNEGLKTKLPFRSPSGFPHTQKSYQRRKKWPCTTNSIVGFFTPFSLLIGPVYIPISFRESLRFLGRPRLPVPGPPRRPEVPLPRPRPPSSEGPLYFSLGEVPEIKKRVCPPGAPLP